MATILRADEIELQLCEPKAQAFTAPGWAFELKLDGFRLLAERIGGKVRLVLRRGREATKNFPEIVAALESLPGPDFIFDGEVVIQDEQGHPVFQRLLKRSTLVSQRDIDLATRADPAVYFAFDLLMLDGEDLRKRPLTERKALLFQLLAPKTTDRVMPVDHLEAQGELLLDIVKKKGLEGVVAKRLDSPYRGGRGGEWIKIALKHTYDFAVVGHADDWGALYFATWDGEQLVYAGKVGSGFTPKIAETVKAELTAHHVKKPPCIGDVPKEREAVWCEATLVIEVRYKNWPDGLAPREPAFLRFRDDKTVKECPTPKGRSPHRASIDQLAGVEAMPSPDVPTVTHAAVSSKVTTASRPAVSNPAKIYFPEDGISKNEVVEYYKAISPWMLPYLKDRPLVLVRFPDGIRGKSFFQKQKPLKAPDFVRSVLAYSEEQDKDIEQIVCDDLQTLEWCANLGAIPIHIPSARVAAPGRPDWCSVDFDPKEASFASVITLASTLRRLCEDSGLPAFVKTSGSSGLHVLIPLGGQLDFPGARQLAELLAHMLVARHPDLATTERMIPKRAGRVYLDTGQNGDGKVIAAPFCVRPHPTAPVSMPLEWDEVASGLTPRQFTLREALARVEKKGDPMAPVLTLKPAFAEILGKLSAA